MQIINSFSIMKFVYAFIHKMFSPFYKVLGSRPIWMATICYLVPYVQYHFILLSMNIVYDKLFAVFSEGMFCHISMMNV